MVINGGSTLRLRNQIDMTAMKIPPLRHHITAGSVKKLDGRKVEVGRTAYDDYGEGLGDWTTAYCDLDVNTGPVHESREGRINFEPLDVTLRVDGHGQWCDVGLVSRRRECKDLVVG
jgi:hypothetical protein